jgi:hypothetical protein
MGYSYSHSDVSAPFFLPLTVTAAGGKSRQPSWRSEDSSDAFFGASHRPPPDERRQWPIPPGARAPELVGASSRSGFLSLCGGDGQRLVGFGFGPLPRATPRSSSLKPCCVRPTNGDNSRQSVLTLEPFWKWEPAAGADSFFLPRRRASRRVRVLCSLIVDQARSTPRRAAGGGRRDRRRRPVLSTERSRAAGPARRERQSRPTNGPPESGFGRPPSLLAVVASACGQSGMSSTSPLILLGLLLREQLSLVTLPLGCEIFLDDVTTPKKILLEIGILFSP